MTSQIYNKILSEGINAAIGKMDPQMIFSLASDVISSYNNLREMKVKGEIFLAAIKEHEVTVRESMKQQTEQTNQIISALKMIIEKTETKEERFQCLKYLVEFGSNAIEKLHDTAEIAFNTLPQLPGGRDK